MAWRMQGIPRGQLALVNVVNNVVHFKYEQLSLSFSLAVSLFLSSLCSCCLQCCQEFRWQFDTPCTLVLSLKHPLALPRSSPYACHQFYCRVARKFQVRQYMPRFYGFHVARAPVNDLGIVPTLFGQPFGLMGPPFGQGGVSLWPDSCLVPLASIQLAADAFII